MRITGYRTLTEKERDYLTIHRLLRKYQISTMKIAEFDEEFLSALKGYLPSAYADPSILVEFNIVITPEFDYTIFLDQLPENTIKLLIEV